MHKQYGLEPHRLHQQKSTMGTLNHEKNPEQ